MTARLGLALGGITAANMLLWFLLQGYVLARTGIGAQADAFFASLAVPQLVLLVANSTLAHVLIPFFSGKSEAVQRAEAQALALAAAALVGGIAGALWLAAPWWVPVLVPGFDAAATRLAVSLTRVQVLGMPFSAVAAVLLSACHARGRFALAETAPLVGTLAAFAVLVPVLPAHGVAGAAWVNVGRALVGMLVLAPLLAGAPRPAWTALREPWRRMRPLLLSAPYTKSDQLFDRFFTSLAPAGALSLFHFAQQAALAVNAVLGKAVSAPAVPRLALLVRRGEWLQFHRLYRRRLALLTGLSLLCCAGVGAAGAVAVHAGGMERLHLLRVHDVLGALGLFLLLSGVVVGGGAGLVLSEAFFATGDTRTPALVTAACFTAGVAMKAAGFSLAGLQGLALATSAYYLSYPVVLYLLLEAAVGRRRRAADSGPALRAEEAIR